MLSVVPQWRHCWGEIKARFCSWKTKTCLFLFLSNIHILRLLFHIILMTECSAALWHSGAELRHRMGSDTYWSMMSPGALTGCIRMKLNSVQIRTLGSWTEGPRYPRMADDWFIYIWWSKRLVNGHTWLNFFPFPSWTVIIKINVHVTKVRFAHVIIELVGFLSNFLFDIWCLGF